MPISEEEKRERIDKAMENARRAIVMRDSDVSGYIDLFDSARKDIYHLTDKRVILSRWKDLLVVQIDVAPLSMLSLHSMFDIMKSFSVVMLADIVWRQGPEGTKIVYKSRMF